MVQVKGKWSKKTSAILLAGFMISGSLQVLPAKVFAAETITFHTQAGGVYDGMPLFDGVPSHLNAFVDTYFNYVGLEGAALYATGIRDNYTFVMNDNPIKGKTVPGGISAADNVYGVSTDFPSLVGLGQSWDKELLSQVGQVMGNEKISQITVKQGTSNIHNGTPNSKLIAFTALSDVRINPLNGRFPEGYSEDPFLSATMVDNMAAGLSGTDQGASNDGFWIRAIVGTKHYAVYNSEWYRQSASNAASARALYEYQLPSSFKGLESGSVSGVMTSFGRTNGVPNIISPYMILGNDVARYGMYSSPDFNGEQYLYTGFSNGYDTKYTLDRKHALALMVLAHSESVRATGTDKTDVVTLANAVNEGLYGITLHDVQEAGRPMINQLVRAGVFNEVDANGIPRNYPFASQAKDVSSNLTNFSTPAHQEVAKQAARESVVLLKNTDAALPLEKDKKAAVIGAYADMRMKAQYSAGTTTLPDANKTPLYALLNTIGASNVQFKTGGEVVALKSKANDKYLTAGTAAAGAQLTADFTPVDGTFNDAQLFEVYDWGQEATSLLSKANNRWVTAPTTNSATIGNTATANLLLTDTNWSTLKSLGTDSAIPAKLRFENNADNSVSIISGGLAFQTGAFSGRFVTASATDGKISTAGATIGNVAGYNTRNDSVKFDKTTVKEAGSDATALANTQDYALVFVGAHPSNSAAEGTDRADLYLGANDYKLVKNVAAAFAAKNKKTIVVLTASSPVIMKAIQDDPNVSAIVEQPYSGEYDAQGIIDVLYGDYAPTGRLTSTWYADMSALPAMDKYVIPEGNTTATLSQLDPRYTVDMTNADPAESKLTYMYTDAAVTYPFGYGLGYSDFTYKDFNAPSTVNGQSKFDVSVEVTNEGSVATSEIVQVYAKKNDSAYGAETPRKKLVGYEKVDLSAGEHKVVTVSVDPKDLAIWDVNKGDYIVEDGSYAIMAGHSSADIRSASNITVSGDQLAPLAATNLFNVFDHSFASQNVFYSEASKARTVESLRNDQIAGQYYTVNSKQPGAWVALPKADFTGAKKLIANVASTGAGGNITLRADSPSNAPFATIAVPATGVTTYAMPTAADQTVKELGYTAVEAAIDNAPSGLHTVYVVFDAPDIRVDSMQVTESEGAVPDVVNLQLAQFYASHGNPYNAVYYYQLAINNGDTDLDAEMSASAQQLQQQAIGAMEAGQFAQAYSDYQLLSSSPAVPSSVLDDATKSLSSDQNMGNAWYYHGQNNLYNTVFYISEEAGAGNQSTGIHALLTYFAGQMQAQAKTEMQQGQFGKAYTDYQLLASSQGVPASIAQDAASSLAATANLGEAWYYLSANNWYNAVFYLGIEMQSNASTGVTALMNYAAQQLQQQAQSVTASLGSFAQSYGSYVLLSTTSGVPLSIAQDAGKSIDVSDSDYGNALWYLGQLNYENAKYYLQQIATKGNNSTGVTALATYVNGKLG